MLLMLLLLHAAPAATATGSAAATAAAASAACLCNMLRSLLQLQRLHWEFEAHAGLLAMSTKKWLRRMRVMIMG